MKETVTKQDFVERFEDFDRAKDMGGRRNLGYLYDYLLELERDMDMDMELDVIGICCEWVFYADIEEAMADYGIDPEEDIRDYTDVIEAESGVYVRSF